MRVSDPPAAEVMQFVFTQALKCESTLAAHHLDRAMLASSVKVRSTAALPRPIQCAMVILLHPAPL